MPTGQCLRQPFVVPCQASKPAQPSKRPFDHPAPRQQKDALLRRRVLNDFPPNALAVRLQGSGLAHTPLADESDLFPVPGDLYFTSAANSVTWARPWASAGVTTKASKFPSVSTAM